MAWDDKIPADEKKFYNVTRFRPDTCGCVLTYAWDTRTTEDNREHLPADIEHACPAHAHHTAKGKAVDAHHEEVIGENQHKNVVLGAILESLPDEAVEIEMQGKRVIGKHFKRPPRWHFNDARELVVEMDEHLPVARNAISKLGKRAGGRKVHLK